MYRAFSSARNIARSFALAVCIGIFSSLVACAENDESDLTLQEVVAAHEAGVDAVETLDVRLKFCNARNGRLLSTIRWSANSQRQRQRCTLHDPATKKDFFMDRYVDGQMLHSLNHYNPTDPPEITLWRQHGITAALKPQTRRLMDVCGDYYLLRRFRLNGDDDERRLSELVADCQAAFGESGAALVGKKTIRGKETWHIHFQHPGVSEPMTGRRLYVGSCMDVFVDPSVNWMVRRVEAHIKALPTAEGTQDCTSTWEAVSFQDFEVGTFLPVEIASEFTDQDGVKRPEFGHKVIVHSASVNQPLRQDALDFKFPAHLMVHEMDAKGATTKIHLIGEDNQIAETFETPLERQALSDRLRYGGSRFGRPRTWSWICAGVLVILVFSLLLVCGRRSFWQSIWCAHSPRRR